MAHGDAREGKWSGNWRMEWVASTLHTTSEHGVSGITMADAHTSAASSRLNWPPPPPIYMDPSVSPKDEIWFFLRVCHHISTDLYRLPCIWMISLTTKKFAGHEQYVGNVWNAYRILYWELVGMRSLAGVPERKQLGPKKSSLIKGFNCGSEYWTIDEICEHRPEPSNYMGGGEYHDSLSDYCYLKPDPDPWRYGNTKSASPCCVTTTVSTSTLYRGADKSLARPGRKQANVSVRMAWISFGALPCRSKNLMTPRVSMLLKSHASLTRFRACFPFWSG